MIEAAAALRAEVAVRAQPVPRKKISRRGGVSSPVLSPAAATLCRPLEAETGEVIPYYLIKLQRPRLAVGTAIEPEHMCRFTADDGKFVKVNGAYENPGSKPHPAAPRGAYESIPKEYFDVTDARSAGAKSVSLECCEGVYLTREAGLRKIDTTAIFALLTSGRCI